MIHPQNFELKTGFDQVRSLIKNECLSEMGAGLVESIIFSDNQEWLTSELSRVAEFYSILEEGHPCPSDEDFDLRPELSRITTPGTYMPAELLLEMRRSVNNTVDWIILLNKPALSKYQNIKDLISDLVLPTGLIADLDLILDEKGEIRDRASAELAEIRQDIRKKRKASDRVINQLLQQARASGWSASDAEVTIRDGRLVIPVHSSQKKKLKGLVHDESSTGQTVFIEPEACFEINNQVRELENAEKREIIRILVHYTDRLRPEIPELLKAYHFLALIDLTRAKVRFGRLTRSSIPNISTCRNLHLLNAVHPLLLLSHEQKGMEIVPLDLHLTGDDRILVISGPNAGGKSVCLKTTGLLQYMFQCGLPIPADANSELPLFKNIFIDIGDEQSLENDLSTYSSHLLNVNNLLSFADKDTLFLIDEFGSGTDPSLGGAIAEAVLEILARKKALGIVTTHYSNLKTMAEKHQGIINGAMLFDAVNLRPLYRLSIGMPGSSFTFEIAQKIGLDKEVIEIATSKTGSTHLDFERQLQELETERLSLEKQKIEFEVADQFMHELITKYEKKRQEVEEKKQAIIEKARIEAAEILSSANQMIERTIKDIKEHKAEKEITKKLRENLKAQKEKLEPTSPVTHKTNKTPDGRKAPVKFKTGDLVKIKGQDKAGLVVSLKGSHAVIDFDGLHFTVDVSKVETAGKDSVPARIIKRPSISAGDQVNLKAANFRLTIDIRGKRADEAIAIVQKYIDDAIMIGISEFSILHGKGDGILRKVIREMMAGLKEVDFYSDEQPDRGGSGITRVKLK